MYYFDRMKNTPEQIAVLKAKDDGKPVHMLNLLSFREKAEYEDGRKTTLTGYEAYGLYGEVVSKLIIERGGHILFTAAVAGMVVGEDQHLISGTECETCRDPVICLAGVSCDENFFRSRSQV